MLPCTGGAFQLTTVRREGLGGGLFRRPDPIVNNPFFAKNLTDCVEMHVGATNSVELKNRESLLWLASV